MENERVVLRQRAPRSENDQGAIGSSSIVKYTEDGIPIFNLIVKELPQNMAPVDIVKHFSKYGRIQNIDITCRNTCSVPTKCVVRFKEKESAGRALNQGNHFIQNKQVIVKACPSWEQPFEINNVCLTNLFGMNCNCLLDIFKKLNLQEQVRWSLCCTQLQQYFVRFICPRLPRHLKLETLEQFSSWELNQFFKITGKNLQSIKVGPTLPSNNDLIKICDFIRGNCTQVSGFTLINRSDIFEVFLRTLNPISITELDLFACNLVDANVKSLKKLPNLQSLGLSGNYSISGDGLQYLPKLQRLGLYGCNQMTYESLATCFRICKLRYLDVRWTHHFKFVTRNIGCWDELESIKITTFPNVSLENIMMLPNLKRLEVDLFKYPMPPMAYQQLAEYHARDLVELKLTGLTIANIPAAVGDIVRLQALRVLWLGGNKFNCSPETIRRISDLLELEEISLQNSWELRDDDLCGLITKCRKLKYIDLRGCRQITVQFVERAIAILKSRATTEVKQPVTLLVFKTGIERNILMRPQYKENRQFIKLLFHPFCAKMGLMGQNNAFNINDIEKNFAAYEYREESFYCQ